MTFFDPVAEAAAASATAAKRPPPAEPTAQALLQQLASAWTPAAPQQQHQRRIGGGSAVSSGPAGGGSAAASGPARISDTYQLYSAINRIFDGDTNGVAAAVTNPRDEQSAADRASTPTPELGDVLSDVERSEVPDLKEVLDGDSNGMGQPHAAWHEGELMAGDDPSLSVSRLPETGGGGDSVWQTPFGAGSDVQLPLGSNMNVVETGGFARPVG